MTGHRTVRIACVGLLLVAAAFITGGTSALATGDVTITVNQAGSPVASAGAQGDFSLTVKATNNTGAPVDDTATLSLQLPAGVAPTSGCSGSSSPFSCDVPLVLATTDSDVMVGSIALNADPSSAGSFPGQAGSASTTGGLAIDPFAYNINVAGQADLGIALTGVPASTVAGDTGFTAKATVTNNGPSDSGSDWTASVTLPSSDLAFGTVPDVCSVDVTGLIATCNGSNLNPGGFAEFDLPVSAPHDAAAGDNQINAAVQPGPVSEGANTNSDTDQATVHIATQADLGIGWSGLPTTTQVAGQDSFTPTATVTNTGPSDSGSDWWATLTLPTGFAFHAAPSGCTLSVANTIATCTGQNLDPTSSSTDHRDFSATVDVLHNAPVGNDNVEAKVTHGIPEGADAASNDDVESVPVSAQADLGMTLSGVPSVNQVAGQDSFTATMTVTNGGPSDSGDGWTAALTIPSGFAFGPTQPSGCAPSGQVMTCTGSIIDPTSLNPSAQFPIQVKVLHNAVVGDNSLSAAVTPTLPEGPSPTLSNGDSATAHVIALADLALSVTTTPGAGASSPYLAGENTLGAFSYNYTVTNNGPSDHSGSYTVTDLLPAGFAFQSGSGCSAVGSVATGQTVTCTDSAVLDPTAGPITFTVGIRVDHTVADGSYPDNASVASGTSATPEPTGSGANNSAAVSVAVYTKADMALDSAAAAPTPIYANSTPAQNTVTFTVKFHNGGPSDARHATLKLNPSLAAHLTGADWCVKVNPTDCTSDPSFTAYNSGTGIDVGQLVPGSSDQVTVLVRAHGIPTDRNGKFTGVTQGFAVSVAAPTQDPSGNNTASANAIEVDTVSTPVRNVQATAGNGNAIVTFEPPTNNGGQPITSYKVTVSPAGGGSPITVLASSPQVLCPNGITTDCYRVNVMPLNNGTLYTIDVQAQNAVGLSDYIAVNPAPEAKVTPSVNASASIVAPAASGTLTTCTVATPTSPTCEQYIIPSGTGGVFGALGNVTLGVGGFPGNLCGGQPCVGQGGTANNLLAAASNSGALAGYDNRKAPLKEVVTWDASTFKPSDKIGCCFPLSVPVYYENSFSLTNFPSKTGTLLNLHFCASPVLFGGAGNINWARPKPIPVGRYNGYFDTAGSACIRTIRVLGGTAATTKGDVQVTINLTSDSDGLAGRH